MGLAFPFGLLAGFGIALLLEYLNQTIRDERDLRSGDRALFLGVLRTFGGGK
jgi:capsular polysaccharide biosynthesis protein